MALGDKQGIIQSLHHKIRVKRHEIYGKDSLTSLYKQELNLALKDGWVAG